MDYAIDHNNVVIPDATTRLQLSKTRTITISAIENSSHEPSAKLLLETYVTVTGQMKRFEFYIRINDLPALIDAFTIIEQVGLDRGIIAQVQADDDQYQDEGE